MLALHQQGSTYQQHNLTRHIIQGLSCILQPVTWVKIRLQGQKAAAKNCVVCHIEADIHFAAVKHGLTVGAHLTSPCPPTPTGTWWNKLSAILDMTGLTSSSVKSADTA